jgi:hypothetical protein
MRECPDADPVSGRFFLRARYERGEGLPLGGREDPAADVGQPAQHGLAAATPTQLNAFR